MKKLIAILIALLVLTGCGKGYSKVNNGDEVIFKDANSSYTRQDLYEALKASSESQIEQDIIGKIAENIGIDMAPIEEEANQTIEMYLSIGYTEENLASYKEMLIQNGVMNELGKVYVNENFDEFVAEDKPVKMQSAYFSDEETANKFINDINNGATFEYAAADNGYPAECPVEVYFDSDALPINVKSYLNSTVSTGLSTIITDTQSTTDADGNITETVKYYVLNIVSKNIEDYKDDYISKKILTVGEEAVKNYFFSNHEIKFYDQDIYEMMKAKYEVLQ